MSKASKLFIVAALAVSASGVVSKVAAQQGPQAGTGRYQAIHACMLRAHQQYPGDQQGDDRYFSYSTCMTSAGFQP